MKFYVSLFLIFLSVFAKAQIKKIDSLNIELKRTIDPAKKIDILLNISRLYMRLKEDSSLIYSQKALIYSDELKDTVRTALSKQRIGKIYITSGKYKSADKILKESAELFIIKHDSLNYAMVLSDLSKVQNFEGDYNNAIKCLIEARTVLRKLNDINREAQILNKLGILYLSLNQNDKAIEYYNYALDIMIKEGYKPAISALYINIGNVYSNLGENETNNVKKLTFCRKAEIYYQKALPIKKEINDTKGLGTCLLNIGVNYSRMQKYKLAEKYLSEAVEICKKTNNLTHLYTSYQNLANNYANSSEFAKALKYAEMVFQAYEKEQFESGVKLKSENHETLFQIYKQQNKNKKAIFHYEEYVKLRDSMYNTDLVKSVNELEVKYQTELKDRQNQILIQENDIQKLHIQKNKIRVIVLFISLLSAFFSIIIILLYIRQRRLRTKQKTVLLEQRLLRSQMNPHFIFNSLTAIQSYILKSKPAEGAKYLSKFATLIRIVLEHSRIEYVPVEKEIESLKYYMDLQKLRYEDQLQYEIIQDESIKSDNCLIPPMLAQPFIENAVEHGIAPSKKDGLIKISFLKKDDKMIEFKVEDNGVGISNTSINRNNESHHSLATQITKERLELLNRNKKDKILFEVKEKTNKNNEVEGVITLFHIPYIINL
ncbi:MAG: tetratricopeptide repeat protein [Calditrichales bacterium]|nr:tetratricopeptide repeat protein [Calditrichales bacterium]